MMNILIVEDDRTLNKGILLTLTQSDTTDGRALTVSAEHQQNPFLVLLSQQTGEDSGEAYGFTLVYSGSFSANADMD